LQTFKMKIYMLKIFYAIEIGAYLAYMGHYKVSGDKEVRRIAREELRHMIVLKRLLKHYKQKPDSRFNGVFFVIGTTIRHLCRIFPGKALNIVAAFLERINVVNYRYAAKKFPHFAFVFDAMQENEEEHERYFKGERHGQENRRDERDVALP